MEVERREETGASNPLRASKPRTRPVLAYLVILGLAAILFAVSSLSLPPLFGGVCIEGGERLGFPLAFYYRCREVTDGQPFGSPSISFGAAAFNVAAWFLVVAGVYHAYRVVREPRVR